MATYQEVKDYAKQFIDQHGIDIFVGETINAWFMTHQLPGIRV